MKQEHLNIDCMFVANESPQPNKSHNPMLKKRNINFEEHQSFDKEFPDYTNKFKIEKKFIISHKKNDYSFGESSNTENQKLQEKHYIYLVPTNYTKEKSNGQDNEDKFLKSEQAKEVANQLKEDIIRSKNDETESSITDSGGEDITSDEYRNDTDITNKDTGENKTIESKQSTKDYFIEYIENHCQKNREKHDERSKKSLRKELDKYYEKNKTIIANKKNIECLKEYQQKIRECHKEHMKEYYIKNREMYKKKRKEYYTKNKEKILENKK